MLGWLLIMMSGRLVVVSMCRFFFVLGVNVMCVGLML